MNPFDQLVADLTAQITSIKLAISAKKAEFAEQQQRRNSWQSKYVNTRPNRRDPNDLAMMADAQSNMDRIAREIDALSDTLRKKEDELGKAIVKRDAVDKAAQDNMAKGQDPGTAYAGSVADLERKQLFNNVIKFVLIGLGIAAVIYGIVVFRRWKRKK